MDLDDADLKTCRHLDPASSAYWEQAYRMGTPPWETGAPAEALVRVVREKLIPRGTVLEIGCGSGADAIFLARNGFEVTAVDVSAIAIERARLRAELEDCLPRFVLADIFRFAPTAGQFDLVYDAGFYHYIRQTNLSGFLDVLWQVTRPGSYYLTVAGATGETAEGGPPQVSADDLHYDLARLFELVELRPCRIASPRRKEGYLGWSCLMRRPILRNTMTG